MKLTSPETFWPIAAGLPASYPSLQKDIHCDVTVIGAGITGALVAWHLAKEGIGTVVIDRRDVAHGSTSASTSLLQYEIDRPIDKLARLRGWDNAVRAFTRCREAIDSIGRISRRLGQSCGFEKKSSLRLASNIAHLPGLRREFEARKKAGFPDEWWSARDLARNSSLRNPAAILSPIGAQIDAYRFTHALLSDACSRGARVFDRSEVKRTKVGSKGVALALSSGAVIRSRYLVHATGYEADLALPKRMTEWKNTYAMVSEPLDSFEGWPAKECLIWETRDPYVYLRTTPDRRAIIGGYDEEYAPAQARDKLLTEKTAMLLRRFRQLFPRIPIEVAYSWAGTFAQTADGLPFIGFQPEARNVWMALGYGGNGITFSLLAAEIIRDGILGRKNADAELFGFHRAIPRT
ncbi:MAG TPA: FAD-dependent oxidoreductase [Opitutaceae bacterium]|jgi:glycine/D-amino acid oxidase-like deaminating enzyme|nr:FAD-dependent oxidoreductase [Opitutaceae bacterium]